MKPQESQQLIFQHQGLVKSLAWRIHQKLPPQVDIRDLIGFGQVGLAEAARDFSTQYNCQFSTYAHYRIRGAIFDGLSKMRWFNRGDYWRGRYENLAGDVLYEEDQPAPSANLPQEAQWLRKTGKKLAVIYVFSQLAKEDNESLAVEDQAAESPASRMMQSELSAKLHDLVDSLPENMATLIRLTYFEGLTITDAGQKLGISKAWASRLHTRAIEELARKLNLGECL